MDRIGREAAISLTLSLLEHPFFLSRNAPDRDQFCKRIGDVKLPSIDERQEFWKFRYNPKEAFILEDSDERNCGHELFIRAFIRNRIFLNYHPTQKEIDSESMTANLGSYSTNRVIIAARNTLSLQERIRGCSAEYSVVCKYETKWLVGKSIYTAEMPIIIIPGLDPNSAARREVSLFEISYVRFKKKKTKHLIYEKAELNEYIAKTGDQDFYVLGRPDLKPKVTN